MQSYQARSPLHQRGSFSLLESLLQFVIHLDVSPKILSTTRISAGKSGLRSLFCALLPSKWHKITLDHPLSELDRALLGRYVQVDGVHIAAYLPRSRTPSLAAVTSRKWTCPLKHRGSQLGGKGSFTALYGIAVCFIGSSSPRARTRV